jgi:hypothetical protein
VTHTDPGLKRRAQPAKKGRTMNQKYIALRTWLARTLDGRRDAGQGTLEYVGAIVIAAVVVVAVMAAFKNLPIANAVTTAVNHILSGT